MTRRLLLGLLTMLSVGQGAALGDEIYTHQATGGVQSLTNVPRSGAQWHRLGATEERRATDRQASTSRSVGPHPFDRAVRRIAAHYGVDPLLVHAVIAVESGHDPNAVSSRGATGLMQLMPATAAELGVHDLKDPYANIVAGVRHLRRLLDRYDGNVDLALAAYNAGVGAVSRYGGVPPFEETRSYIRRVRSRHPGSGLTVASDTNDFTRYVDGNGTLVFTQFPGSSRARVVTSHSER